MRAGDEGWREKGRSSSLVNDGDEVRDQRSDSARNSALMIAEHDARFV